MHIEVIGWWLLAALAVACAVGMITARNPVHSALWLVLNFVALAGIFLVLTAPVLFAIQLIVYAGAIMVLFLFVIMFFMSPEARRWLRPPLRGQLVLGGLLTLAVLVVFLWGASSGGAHMAVGDVVEDGEVVLEFSPPTEGTLGMPVALGAWMFSYQVLPFELTSLLLLAAILGAMMVARDVRGEGRADLPEHAAVVPNDVTSTTGGQA
jgi:NADH-quinone oxidoreductase subunit J